MLASPRFDPADFERERNLQLAEIRQGPDDPNWIARRAFRKVLFHDGPYAEPGDGTAESVKSLTLEDVKKFHDETLLHRAITVIVVGDLDEKALFDTLEATIGKLPAKADSPLDRGGKPGPNRPKTIYLVDKPSAAQSVIRVGRPWVERKDPRYFAALIGNHVLGEDFLSRLNHNLREENGYTYGAMSQFDYRAKSSVWLAATNVFTGVTAPALKEMLAEIDGVAKGKPLTDKEIETARQAIGAVGPRRSSRRPGSPAHSMISRFTTCPRTPWRIISTFSPRRPPTRFARSWKQSANRAAPSSSSAIALKSSRRSRSSIWEKSR